jgi:WhiB family transcriptional regulator, redox-sensing transcriptional regulator
VSSAGKARQATLAVVPPLPPDLVRGLCVPHPDPDLWMSDRPADRDQAVRVCLRCPVIESCRAWAVSQPAAYDLVGVLGGWTVSEREAVRARRQREIGRAAG